MKSLSALSINVGKLTRCTYCSGQFWCALFTFHLNPVLICCSADLLSSVIQYSVYVLRASVVWISEVKCGNHVITSFSSALDKVGSVDTACTK